MTAIGTYKLFFRGRTETAFSAANPQTALEWNSGLSGGGANGWIDLPIIRESPGLQPKTDVIYPSVASGQRAMNSALPLAGADQFGLGNLEFAWYNELCDRLLRCVMGSVNRTPTAGALLDSGGAILLNSDPITVTPDTDADGTEQVKIVVDSTTGVNAATIAVVRNSVTLETITLDGGGGSGDGTYYTKGGYDGSTNSLTFTFTGFGTAGNTTITGVDKNTNVFTQGATNPSMVIEQGGRPEAGSGNSEYFPGVVLPNLALNFDRAATDGLLMGNITVIGERPDPQTAGTYLNDAAVYYRPIAAWNCAVSIDSVATTEIVSSAINLIPNNELYAVASGNQLPTDQVPGLFEVTGELTCLPEDETFWNAYRNQTVYDVHFDFQTPTYIVDTDPYQLLIECTQLTFGDYSRTQNGMIMGATIPFRAIYNSTDSGAVKVTTVSRMPV